MADEPIWPGGGSGGSLPPSAANDVVVCAAPTGVAATDNTNFQAGLTAAAGGTLLLRKGTYNLTTAKTVSSSTKIVADLSTVVDCNIAGVFFDLSGKVDITFEGGRYNVLGTAMTWMLLDDTFGCKLSGVEVVGTHTLGAPQPAEIGLDIRNNSGDNWITNGCEFSSLGIGIRSACFANYLSNSKITNCQYGLYAVNSYGSGMVVTNSTLASTPGGTTISQVYIPHAAGYWLISNTDMEGATNTCVVGSGTAYDGPTHFSLHGCHLAGSTKILDIESAYGCTLVGVSFAADPSTTPTSLTINATGAPDNGYAAGLITNVAADNDDFAASIFPPEWTRLGKTQSQIPGVTSNKSANLWKPTSAISETHPRATRIDVCGVLASGTLHLGGGCVIPAGVAVNNITFVSSSTGAGTPAHWWFCLVDQALNVLAKTADQTTTAWAANTAKTLALTAAYTPTADIAVYCGILVVASTVPTLCGVVATAGGSGVSLLKPAIAGQSSGGLTTPASLGSPAGALVAGDHAYAYLS